MSENLCAFKSEISLRCLVIKQVDFDIIPKVKHVQAPDGGTPRHSRCKNFMKT